MKSRVANQSLADVMDRHAVEAAAELCRSEGDRLRCLACGHRCLIGDGLRGICKVRFNDGGRLMVPFGYVAGLQCDPVEKKPFFHVHPGSDALTFGMLGCDLHCSYCQNWITSQSLRDKNAVAPLRPITAEQLIAAAHREQARLVVSSYNEPLITAEWAVHVFREAAGADLDCAFVSNGNATPEVLDFLRPWIIAYKVDLKSFNDRNYRSLGGALDNITQTIRMVHERGVWLEVVTLVIPGFNDNPDELRQAADFLASVSPDIPWHVTAFHQDYKMTEPDPTSADALIRAAEMGAAAGLRYVYAGNLPGKVGPWENTRCPSCSTTLIERIGYLVRSYRISDGRCPDCQTAIPGVWPASADKVRTGKDLAAYRSRLPRKAEALRSLPVVESSPPGSFAGAQAMSTALTIPPVSQASRPSLTEQHKQQLIAATSALLHAAVAGKRAAFPAELAELRDLTVAGTFVSLKRGRHLRACCGQLGAPLPLAQALEQSVTRTAWEDVRFPAISPTELEYLRMEIWLLFSMERVAERGEDRLRAITLGKHGVKVMRGESHGLFLPSVAVENGWDVSRLLDQVCIKAGLPATAWRHDDTAVFTFEGEALGATLAESTCPKPALRPGVCRREDLPAFVNYCRDNLIAVLFGATPNFFLWGAPDGTVSGVVLQVQRPGTAEALHFSQIMLRNGIPLQATLFSLIQTAAQKLAAFRIRAETVGALSVQLAVLHDPVLHGTVADPQLAGVNPGQRALLVVERNRSAMHFHPEQSAEELLAEVAGLAEVTQPAAAAVYSFGITASASPFRVATVPRPVRGPAVRPPAVAGMFYPANPEELTRIVDELLAGERQPESWPAAMVPHAGLRFSGSVAAAVLRRLHIPRTVIVIGPKHTPLGVDWAVAPQQTWALPGGEVAADFLLARKLCQAIPGLEMDAAAHQREHAIEVELPLLARLAPEVKVIGIAIGHGDLATCKRFAAGLADLLHSMPERPLLLISSDMNHFATDAETRRLDALALAALQRCDPESLHETVNRQHISMCGALPAVIVLETLRLLGHGQRAEQVAYATTADVTGDPTRVVGYAGMLLG